MFPGCISSQYTHACQGFAIQEGFAAWKCNKKSVKAPPLLNAPLSKDKKFRYRTDCCVSCKVVHVTVFSRGPYIDIDSSSKNCLVSFQTSNLECLSGKPCFAISLQIASRADWEQKGIENLKSLIFLFFGSCPPEDIAHGTKGKGLAMPLGSESKRLDAWFLCMSQNVLASFAKTKKLVATWLTNCCTTCKHTRASCAAVSHFCFQACYCNSLKPVQAAACTQPAKAKESLQWAKCACNGCCPIFHLSKLPPPIKMSLIDLEGSQHQSSLGQQGPSHGIHPLWNQCCQRSAWGTASRSSIPPSLQNKVGIKRLKEKLGSCQLTHFGHVETQSIHRNCVWSQTCWVHTLKPG